jgi:hypothetical protein
MSQKPTPPNLGHTFKPYNPQSMRVLHRRSPVEDAPSLIGGKQYSAPVVAKVLKTPASYKTPTSLKVSKKPKEQL